MNIGSIKEDLNLEKRISIVPETVKKLVDLNFSVFLEKSYGDHLAINDEEYKNKGTNLKNSAEEVLEKSDIVLSVNCPSSNIIHSIKDKSVLIGQFDPHSNKETINKLIKKNIKIFSLNLLPRITRAQSMDVLSSQANLAGYRAVIESVEEFGKAIPMMMTAAGTVTPAKVMVIGAGVAGLQAIATAKRLGAIVSATDVRTVAKEQVESLGGKFLAVKGSENLETAGGYAKEAGEDFKKKQSELLKDAVKKNDIIICTALIPGKKAPRIISEDMVKSMRPGSIIYDLAAGQGGNSAFSNTEKINEVNGVKVMGAKNILNNLALTASNLYAKNLFNLINKFQNDNNKYILGLSTMGTSAACIFKGRELIAAIEEYQSSKNGMITLEYILIAGLNDNLSQALALGKIAERLRAKLNLIPYNEVDEFQWERPRQSTQDAFLNKLIKLGVPATLRREKGHDIDAACGQLRLRTEKELDANRS